MAHGNAAMGNDKVLGAMSGATVIPTLEEVVEKEKTKCSWCREELELLLKYKDVVKRALLNAIKKTRSCVLYYEYIYDEIYSLIDDEDVAWSVENSLYGVIYGVRVDDVVTYKIYVDEDESINDIVVVLVGDELTEQQVKMLKDIAELLAAKQYDRFSEEERQFYDATPLGVYERIEVYTVLHNLVCTWTNCRDVIEELEEEDEI
jgi:hypothetical protein